MNRSYTYEVLSTSEVKLQSHTIYMSLGWVRHVMSWCVWANENGCEVSEATNVIQDGGWSGDGVCVDTVFIRIKFQWQLNFKGFFLAHKHPWVLNRVIFCLPGERQMKWNEWKYRVVYGKKLS